MFVILLNYIAPIEQVNDILDEHRAYLDIHYKSGHFLMSGPQSPRIGGVILAKAKTKEELESLLENDPFKISGVAQYNIIEFDPVKMACGIEKLI